MQSVCPSTSLPHWTPEAILIHSLIRIGEARWSTQCELFHEKFLHHQLQKGTETPRCSIMKKDGREIHSRNRHCPGEVGPCHDPTYCWTSSGFLTMETKQVETEIITPPTRKKVLALVISITFVKYLSSIGICKEKFQTSLSFFSMRYHPASVPCKFFQSEPRSTGTRASNKQHESEQQKSARCNLLMSVSNKTQPKQNKSITQKSKFCRFWCKEQSDIKPSGTLSPARKSMMPYLHNVCKINMPCIQLYHGPLSIVGRNQCSKIPNTAKTLTDQNQVSCLMCKPPPPARNMPCLDFRDLDMRRQTTWP